MSPLLLLAGLGLLLAHVCPGASTFRKCCPAGEQLTIDLRTCAPHKVASQDPYYYSAEPDTTHDRPRRDADDWGWLPVDVLIVDSHSLQPVSLDDLRREARDADADLSRASSRRSRVGLPRVEWGVGPPCEAHETELAFWDDAVQLFSNGSLLVHQERADLFRPGDANSAGDEGSRGFLFEPSAFCMDRISLAPVAVPLEGRNGDDVEEEVEDAVLDEEARHHDNSTSAAHTLPPDEDGDHHVILLCPYARLGALCVRKCCHERSVLVVDAEGGTACQFLGTATGEDVDEPSDVAAAAVYNHQRTQRTREWGPSQHHLPDQPAEDLFVVHGFPKCSNPEGRRFLLNPPTLFNSSEASEFWILPDGSALVDIFGSDSPVPTGAFCGEVAMDVQTGLRAANLLVCSDPGVLGAPRARWLYGVLAAAGAAFLAATLLVHACLPEMRRSLHSSNLMAHTGSLLLAYIALAASHMVGPGLPRTACLLLAFVLQFSFLAAFFWLNVMCVDISWAFSGLRLPQGSAAERDRKKFLWYSLYAWGGTSAITLTTAAMELMPPGGMASDESAWHVLHPQIGVVGCWFKETTAVLLYFYGPMAFLLLANVILFVYTAARILAVRKDTAILHKADSARSPAGADSQRLVLYVKLFCLMGLTWVTEIISWAVGGHDYYWFATDAVNLLRAVFIFIIFCCKRKVLRLLLDKLSGSGGGSGRGRGGGSGGTRPRGRRGGRGAATLTSSLQTGSLTIHLDARRLQHMGSQDSALGSNTTTTTSPSATPDGIVLSVR